MKEKLKFEQTEDTPRVILDPSNHQFELAGRSYPENAREFYAPILKWLEEYGNQPVSETVLEINLDYFNSGSVKEIFRILYLLEEIMEKGHAVKVKWYFSNGDELIYQKGLEFQKFLMLPVEIVER